ncbi:MAG: Hsp20/alpha crystallin family protein [Tepidisphaeraceae bacterium]
MPPQTVAGPFSNVTPQLARMMEQLTKGYYGFMPNEVWTPNVNLYETDTAYHVCVDLSGVEKDKIDITVQDQRLTLRGARPVPQCLFSQGEPEHQRIRVHLMEIDHGAFAREIELPNDIIKEGISARYNDGLLWIELPKK